MTQSGEISFELPFAKFHAAGNDFIVVPENDIRKLLEHARGVLGEMSPEDTAPNRFLLLRSSMLARQICDRHTGIGADGLILLREPSGRRHLGKIRIRNSDGSEAEMSGNGIRCAAAYILDSARQRLESKPGNKQAQRVSRLRELRIETPAGVKSLQMLEADKGHWVFRVAMGEPILQAKKIPFKASTGHSPVIGFPLETSRGILKVTVTSMGNPHCTVPVSDFDAFDWADLGREIEASELFPKRTNVEFVRVISRNEIEVRFWERGVGKTQSSGTGSCAAVVACVLNGLTSRKVRAQTLAGALDVAWPEGKEVTLTGPVELIARGTYYFSNRRDR